MTAASVTVAAETALGMAPGNSIPENVAVEMRSGPGTEDSIPYVVPSPTVSKTETHACSTVGPPDAFAGVGVGADMSCTYIDDPEDV